MSISAVSGITSQAVSTVSAPTVSTTGTSGSSFSSMLSGAIDSVQSTQATSDQLNIAAVTGDLTDIHAATIASTRAQVTLELVSAVRNQGVSAFNSIMNMSA